MKKQTSVKKDILISVLVLATIALVCGILLGIIYPLTRLTQAEIDERASKPLQTIYPSKNGYEVVKFQSNDNNLNNAISYLFKSKSEEDVYIALSTGEGGYGGSIEMYVVFKGNKIIKVEKSKNKETPGISDAAFNEKFYEQFLQKDILKIDSFKIESGSSDYQIDSASGATKTSNGITNSINNAMKFYKEYYEKFLAGIKHTIEGNKHIFEVREEGSYVKGTQTVNAYVKLKITIENDVITDVKDDGSTFSPTQYSDGLKQERLNIYVGKNVIQIGEFKYGENGIDVTTGATGTSDAILRAVNRVVEKYKSYVGGIKHTQENGLHIFQVREEGSYVKGTQTVKAYVKLKITIENDVITEVKDDGSTFSPTQYSDGLKQERLNIYVGKNVVQIGEFEYGENGIDVTTGATGTSDAILRAVNRVVEKYQAFVGEIKHTQGNGLHIFQVREEGSYVKGTQTVKAYVKLKITIKNDVITEVKDDGSTFSPTQYSDGLKQERLNIYVGKNVVQIGEFKYGENGIDVTTGATGTSDTILRAVNKVVQFYNREVAK